MLPHDRYSYAPVPAPKHQHLPDTRTGRIKRVIIGGKKIYLHDGYYADNRLGEIFIRIDKAGDEFAIYDMFAIALSVGLQHGIPLAVFDEKFRHQRFEPSGITSDERIPIASSIIDYLFRWLAHE